MTTLALAPDTRIGYEPAAAARVDRAIRVSTAIAVLAVAGVAAYVSYWHAYAVVCAHGETGITARLEPATIDGLVYASSMVNLYAARHRLPVPALACGLLALGIIASLAVNVAQGWSNGPVGAVVAAWPAVSLVGSYELLVWIIRTAAAGDLVRGPQADHCGTSLGFAAAQRPDAGPGNLAGLDTDLTPGGADGQLRVRGMAGTGLTGGPGWNAADHADQAADQSSGSRGPVTAASQGGDINADAVAAYRASVQACQPLSERKLAGQFGKTSRRWARNPMAQARQTPAPAFSASGLATYLDDPVLGFGHAATDLDDLGIPRFSPELPRIPVALVERHQALWTHPGNDGPRQEVWTEQALSQGMQRIGAPGVRQLPSLDGWLIAEWPRDGGGIQLQQPDGTLFVYALCQVDPAWTAAARDTQRCWSCMARTSACASRPAGPTPRTSAGLSWPVPGRTDWSPADSCDGVEPGHHNPGDLRVKISDLPGHGSLGRHVSSPGPGRESACGAAGPPRQPRPGGDNHTPADSQASRVRLGSQCSTRAPAGR